MRRPARRADSLVIGPRQLETELAELEDLPGVTVWPVGRSYQAHRLRRGRAPASPAGRRAPRASSYPTKPTCLIVAPPRQRDLQHHRRAGPDPRPGDRPCAARLAGWRQPRLSALRQPGRGRRPRPREGGAPALEAPRRALQRRGHGDRHRSLQPPHGFRRGALPLGNLATLAARRHRRQPRRALARVVPALRRLQLTAAFPRLVSGGASHDLRHRDLCGRRGAPLPAQRRRVAAFRRDPSRAQRAWLHERNRFWLERYDAYGHQWFAETSPKDVYDDMLFFYRGWTGAGTR